jgi:hypothetical protein
MYGGGKQTVDKRENTNIKIWRVNEMYMSTMWLTLIIYPFLAKLGYIQPPRMKDCVSNKNINVVQPIKSGHLIEKVPKKSAVTFP